jgi:probable HAF family extracellular repeat protein
VRSRFLIVLALLAAALSTPLVSRAGGEPPANSYEFVQIGAPGFGNDLNDAGHVVGGFYGADGEHAFFWANGVWTDLGKLGGDHATAAAVNNLDQVVGWSDTLPGALRGFRWSASTGMEDLGTLGGTWSTARDINDAGQVAGSSANAAGDERATLWQGGQAYDLGVLPGYASSAAYGISASGEVVGYLRNFANETRAFRWTPAVPNGTTGTMVVLQPDRGSAAYGINSAGDTVGEAVSADEFFSWATLWDAAGEHPIPPLPWSFASAALDINAARTVVGHDFLDDGFDTVTWAYAWSPAYGTRHLDLLATSGFPSLDSAVAVNASGQILANGSGTAYVLSPSAIPHRPNDLYALTQATGVSLTWSPSSGAEQYIIQRATAGGSYTTLGSVTGTSFTDTAVASDTTYSYVVSAANAYGRSGPSYPVTVTLGPAPPTNLTATAARAKRRVELRWRQSTSPGVTQNRIYRSTTSGGPYTLRATLSPTTSYADTSVSSGVTYYYVVNAVTSIGRSSAFSNQAAVVPR